MIEVTPEGLFCAEGGFYIDPWRGVDQAIITHAHADHGRFGSKHYHCASSGTGILQTRLGPAARITGIPFGERRRFGNVIVSLHPAGHILGSAQVRVEGRGGIWVVTGDFKTGSDSSCETFEAVPCDVLIMESTFGLPVYRWPEPSAVFAQINQWWRENAAAGRTSILFAYALGKAQRVLCGLDPTIGPIGIHGAVDKLNPHYAAWGAPLPPMLLANAENRAALKGDGLIVAPGSARNSPWIRRFAPFSTAFASGWMQVRGSRRSRALDRGFVLSDHADWDGLLATIRASGARRIGVTHGYTEVLARWITEEMGLEAFVVPTRFTGESSDLRDEDEGPQS